MSGDNIVDLYGHTDAPPRPAEQPSDKVEYQAIDVDRVNTNVMDVLVYYSNQDMELVPYASRLSVMSPNDTSLSWITIAGSINLTGRNLRQLFPALQDRSVKTIRVFDPAIHADPPEDAPCIERLEYTYHQSRSD